MGIVITAILVGTQPNITEYNIDQLDTRKLLKDMELGEGYVYVLHLEVTFGYKGLSVAFKLCFSFCFLLRVISL